MKRVLLACLVLGVAFAGLNTAHAAVQFMINPGFEIGGYVPGSGAPDYTDPSQPPADHNAAPWSIWGGWSPPNAYPQAAIPNPFIDANNGSPRVWANFNNPTYVNAASQNIGILRPATGMWLIPDATYRVQAQYYVPSSEVVAGVIPRALIQLAMQGGYATQRPLSASYTTPGLESPVITALDQWFAFDFDWTWDAVANPDPRSVGYPYYGLLGGDDATQTFRDNPGGYFDNLMMTSDDYRDDLMGYVKDLSGNPVEGATVRLRSPFIDYASMTPEQIEAGTSMDEVTTEADGSYAMPTWAPLGYEFSVEATLGALTSDGQSLMVGAGQGEGQFPDLTIVPEPSSVILLLTGLVGLMAWRRRK